MAGHAATSGPQWKRDFGSRFLFRRVLRPADLPPADPRIIDLALLDMHHGWPNLGHDSLVRAVGEIAHDLQPLLKEGGMSVRILSFEVRRNHAIPEVPGQRFRIYIGSGGPGHIDPRRNDGICPEAQGVRENPEWEAPLFRLFDDILRCRDAVLLGVCHSFGVLCRWSGVATPVLRGPEKGGKSTGLVESTLTSDALRHPWFSRFAARLSDGRRFKALDSRLFDLIPASRPFPEGALALSYESGPAAGSGGMALTMLELAAKEGGTMPRVLAVNHHPEIRDRRRQRRVLELMFSRGEVTKEWYRERSESLVQVFDDPESEEAVMLSSQFTLLAPLRFHLYREVRRRAAELGVKTSLHEDLVLRRPSGLLDRDSDYP